MFTFAGILELPINGGLLGKIAARVVVDEMVECGVTIACVPDNDKWCYIYVVAAFVCSFDVPTGIHGCSDDGYTGEGVYSFVSY